MDYFNFAPTPKLIAGKNSIQQMGIFAKSYGEQILLVTGKSSLAKSGYLDPILNMFTDEGLTVNRAVIEAEPSPHMVDEIVCKYRNQVPSCVVAIGGGSVLDAGKAISAMLCEQEPTKLFLEGVGTRIPSGDKVPFIAIPTTAGTGSEATKNAVLSETGSNGYKKSLRHDSYIPNVAFIDPLLHVSNSRELTACCGMDALAQLLESYVSTASHDISDAFVEKGLYLLGRSFLRAYESGQDVEARMDMAMASYFSGVTLANVGLGTVHGFASVAGGKFHVPHGVVCGTLIAELIRSNLCEIKSKFGRSHWAYIKYARAGELLSGKRIDREEEGVVQLQYILDHWTAFMKIPLFSSYQINSDHLKQMARETSNKNNPVELRLEGIEEMLLRRL